MAEAEVQTSHTEDFNFHLVFSNHDGVETICDAKFSTDRRKLLPEICILRENRGWEGRGVFGT